MTKFKIYLIGLLISIPILFGACSDDDNDKSLHIEGSKQEKLDGKSFTKQVKVKSDVVWNTTLEGRTDWLTVIQKEDGFDVLAAPNTTNSVRSAKIVISGDGLRDTYSIEQEPADVELEFITKYSETWLNYHQTEFEFYIYSKSDWTLASNATWVTIDNTTGKAGSTKVKVSFDANSNKDKREAVLTLKTEAKEVKHSLFQRGKKSFDDATHHFYVHQATFPVLYTGIHMLSHDKPSYLIDSRNTLLTDQLPSHVKHLDVAQFPNNVADIIRSINEDDPDATFAYYAEDIRINYAISIFTRLGIDTSRVKITIFPDGASTYTTSFSNQFSKEGDGGARYKEIQEQFSKFYTDRLNNPTIGVVDAIEQKGMTDEDFPHIMAGYSNFRFYVQDMDYMITDDAYVKEQVKKNNYVVKTPLAFLNEQPKEKQDKFYAMTGFDKAKYEAQLNESGKPNLVILGTNTAGNPTVDAKKQEAYVQEVMNTYSKEYDIFYKAHPADPAYVDYESKFPGLKLIMPAKMPFDVYTWALNDRIDAIGGFNSTVFLSMPLDKVKFMFAKDAEALGTVFSDLFGGREDIYWIDK